MAGRLDDYVAIVDDDPALNALLVAALERRGFRARGFTRPVEAFYELLDAPPAALVVDLCMPDLDGFDFFRRMQSSCPDVPVIMITAEDSVQARMLRRALPGMGGAAFLPKPIEMDGFLATVARVSRLTPAVPAPAAGASVAVAAVDPVLSLVRETHVWVRDPVEERARACGQRFGEVPSIQAVLVAAHETLGARWLAELLGRLGGHRPPGIAADTPLLLVGGTVVDCRAGDLLLCCATLEDAYALARALDETLRAAGRREPLAAELYLRSADGGFALEDTDIAAG